MLTVSADREPRKDKRLGQIFLRDSGVWFPPDTNHMGPLAIEQVIGPGGTEKFSKASVSIEVAGDEFAGAPVKGTLCRQTLSIREVQQAIWPAAARSARPCRPEDAGGAGAGGKA